MSFDNSTKNGLIAALMDLVAVVSAVVVVMRLPRYQPQRLI